MDEVEFYGPVIVGNSLESQKNPIIFQSKPRTIEHFGIDSYKKTNLDATNNITTFGKISYKKKSEKLKLYKKFLHNNKNNYHSLSEEHLNNMVKILNKVEISEKDIPRSFKNVDINKPFYPSNNYN